jgi:hypothetical protein
VSIERDTDFEHPSHDAIEALVDGRLDAFDREIVESHLEVCRLCAEDAADLRAVQRDIGAGDAPRPVAAPQRTWIRPAVAAAGIAAMILVGVWLRDRSANAPVAAPAPIQANNAPPPAVAPAAALTPEEQVIVDRVIAAGRVELPPVDRALAGSVGTLLGSRRVVLPLAPIAPIGTAVLLPRPEFSWQEMPGVTSYSVAIFDEKFALVAESGNLTRTSWTPATDLPRGAVLIWQITAHRPEGNVISPAPPQPEARFRVLSADDAARVTDQTGRLRDQPLALGILLAHAGLVPEAARQLERAGATALLTSLRFPK